MNDKELIYLLRQADLELEASAPDEDPLRTAACLTWDDIDTIARHAAPTPHPKLLENWEHVEGCVWCGRAITRMVAELEAVHDAGANVNDGAIFDSSHPDFRYPVARMGASAGIGNNSFAESAAQWVTSWLRGKAMALEGQPPLYFDDAGTLHIDVRAKELRGEVRLNLLLDGSPLYLGDARVEDGSVRCAWELPEWNLRSLALPEELLEVVR